MEAARTAGSRRAGRAAVNWRPALDIRSCTRQSAVMRKMFLAIALLALSGCNTSGVKEALGTRVEGEEVLAQTSVPFNPENARYVLKPGISGLSGRVNLVGMDGVQRLPDSGWVELWPVTPHTTDRISTRFEGAKLSRSQIRITNKDPRLSKFTRRTNLGPGGVFRFAGLAPGPYYVLGYSAITTSTASVNSGVAWTRVNVPPGQQATVEVTGL